MQFTKDDKPSWGREKDVEWDQQSLFDNNGSNAATKFNPDDADVEFRMSDDPSKKQDRWFQLRKLNDGVGESDRRQQNRTDDRLSDVRLVASECGLSKREIHAIERLVEDIDFRFGPGVTAEYVLLSLVVIASYENRDIMNDNRFNDFVDSWKLDIDTLNRTISLVKDRISVDNQ